MNPIYRDIFRAIHEGKWLSIEYNNQEKGVTRFWIGIKDLNMRQRTMAVEGLHLSQYSVKNLDRLKIDSILSSKVVEGSYCPINESLVRDIYLNPHKYNTLFDNTANLKILTYLEMCNRMDCNPYHRDFALVHMLDGDKLQNGQYLLNEEQFREIVRNFQVKAEQPQKLGGRLTIQQLAMNELSIHTPKGLYVLAYRRLYLDVSSKMLRAADEITVCTEFTIDGSVQSIRRYLDAEEYELLKDFEGNRERIKDCITAHRTRQKAEVDDMPYIIGLGMDVVLDLHSEYKAILEMYQENLAPDSIKAFFGNVLERAKDKPVPIALVDKRVNLDQLLAINSAMTQHVTYIQGPPGTGKTNTIIHTIITAFFNEKTVLFASYNNHPINGVFEKLSQMEYRGRRIPFPILRLGNRDKLKEALEYIRRLHKQTKDITVFSSTLDRNKTDRKRRARQLSSLLESYEELLELQERRETIQCMVEYEDRQIPSLQMVPFQADLKGRQLKMLNQQIERRAGISEEQALQLLDDNTEELKQYLYYTSAGYIKKLDGEEFADFRKILYPENSDKNSEGEENGQDIIENPKRENVKEEEILDAFAKYLSEPENVLKLQKVFPVMATTCISAHRLGEPKRMFDMVIMDEASQCNTAISLVPIIRGDRLMLVGDPQQLNPVIMLNELVNEKLKKKYLVSDEYDYCKNSIYKTYLACDAVSDEILLHNHYRCHQKIIGFNNQKYYNSRLRIQSQSHEKEPLQFVDVQDASAVQKNTAPHEAREIARYAALHSDKTIGVITPFVNQKALIEQALKEEGVGNVICGTVHAFQGDEKDVILFSTAITDRTHAGTYGWLKNNKELINVATSRARDKLIVLGSLKNIERLHEQQKVGHERQEADDLYELIQYVCSNGQSIVTPKQANSRALGVKPFSTATEEAFLGNLNHALENIWMTQSRYSVEKEVPISHVFQDNEDYNDLFYTGRFDFVVYEKQGEQKFAMLAIELDGKEHFEDEIVKERDRKKNDICKAHNLRIIRVENSYARRYYHIKGILEKYFRTMH